MSWISGGQGASSLWMYRETRPGQCNEMARNGQIPCHAGIYIKLWIVACQKHDLS